jgi:hypothetical protein
LDHLQGAYTRTLLKLLKLDFFKYQLKHPFLKNVILVTLAKFSCMHPEDGPGGPKHVGAEK